MKIITKETGALLEDIKKDDIVQIIGILNNNQKDRGIVIDIEQEFGSEVIHILSRESPDKVKIDSYFINGEGIKSFQRHEFYDESSPMYSHYNLLLKNNQL